METMPRNRINRQDGAASVHPESFEVTFVQDEQGDAQKSVATYSSGQRDLSCNEPILSPPQDTGMHLDMKSENPSKGLDLVGGSELVNDEELPDINIVWWSGPNDPENPMNWPTWRKSLTCGLISVLTFVTPLASSIFAPTVPALMEDFHSDSRELAAFVVSVYLLGFSFGPLVIAPLSEIYGRNVVYHACNMGFLVFLISCALAPTLNSLIAFRFLSGIL